MFELRDYQNESIVELENIVNKLLSYSENKVCVFKSPTGSGKTIMMAEFMQKFISNRSDNKKFSFIWIAVHKLHEQSKEKLEKHYSDSRVLKCSTFDELEDKKIDENEILFFNWQSINKKDNVYIRDNENDNNLTTVLENTKSEDREIILIIDESHHTADSEKSKLLLEDIGAKVTIEVSATPQIKDISGIIEVDFQRVIDEEMIKKEVSLNPNLEKLKIDDTSEDTLVIDAALQKRKDLVDYYKKEKSNVNPLLLIQLPDSKGGVLERKDDIIEILKNKFNISTDNGKLAVYLSDKDNKINLENIEKNDNEVEVLIFKQAIAIGWNCPRASILVLFRNWKSLEFSIQTVGRIMRMPELHHYESDDLNRAYVFTNLSDVDIAEDIAKDYITIYESQRNEKNYDSVDLESIHIKRKHEKTRLSGEISKIFQKIAKKGNLIKKITLKPTQLLNEILVDGKIVKLDKIQTVEHDGT